MILSALLLVGVFAPQAAPEFVRHDLYCTLDPSAGTMAVRTVVAAQEPWLRSGTIRFRLATVMEQPKVTLDGQPVTLTSRSNDKEIDYTFPVPEALRSKKTASIEFSYKSTGKDGFVFHLGPEGTFAGGYNTIWYPRFGSDRSVGKMTFEVPSPIVVKASGKPVSDTNRGDKREFVFDVSAPAVLTFAAAPYIVKKIDGKLPITLYLLKDRPQAEDYVRGCWEIVNILEGQFGKYPFPDFAIIETPSPISQQNGFSGASFEGFIFADSNSLDTPFNLAYFGHEIGHQWWGNLVQRAGQKGNYILSESLAQYGSLRVVETIQGKAAAGQYRRDGYPGYSPSQCGRHAIFMGPGGFDYPLANLPNDPASHQLANAKGFLAFEALARTMGHDRFSRGLKRVTREFAWRAVTFDGLIAELQKETSVDLKPHVRQWFERTGAPTVALRWVDKDGRLVATLDQKVPHYLLSLPIQVNYTDGTSSWHEAALTGASTDVEIRPRKRVVSVVLDPNYEVFHSTPELDTEAAALRYVTLGQIRSLQNRPQEVEQAYKQALENLPSQDPWGVEYKARLSLAGVSRRAGRLKEARELYHAALLSPIRVAADLPWIYLRLAQIARLEKDTAAEAWALRQMENADAALTVSTGAPAKARRQ